MSSFRGLMWWWSESGGAKVSWTVAHLLAGWRRPGCSSLRQLGSERRSPQKDQAEIIQHRFCRSHRLLK